MMQRRRYKALAALLALSVVAAGCGDDDDDAASDDGSSDTTAAEVEGPPAVTLDEECEAAQADGVTAPEGFQRQPGHRHRAGRRRHVQPATPTTRWWRPSECFGFETSFIETRVRGRLRDEHRHLARGVNPTW